VVGCEPARKVIEIERLKMNLADIFLKTAANQPSHAAILGPQEEVLTYSELAAKIERMAQKLLSAGVQNGQTIGLHCASGTDYIVLNYAIWHCGACVVPIAPEMSSDEKKQLCREIALDAILSKPEVTDALLCFAASAPSEIESNIWRMPVRQSPTRPPAFAGINAAFLRFTSGTTGASKGVVLSHETIYARICAANEALHLSPNDRVVWLLSMSYHFAVSIVAYLTFGATIILPKTLFGSTIIKTAYKHKATMFYGPPLQYELMAHDPTDLMLPSLRLAISTTASLSRKTAEACFRRFGIGLNQAYGIIEIGLPCINVDSPMGKMGSVGPVLPSYEILLEDIGLGEKLQAIKLRGKGFVDAYYSPWQPRQEIMRDGWFDTGDLGYLDRDGHLFIKGRSKEIINVAGMKFFPSETETVLNTHFAVSESCVFAHKHERLGEIPYAIIVLLPNSESSTTETELKEYCSRHLAAFKVPEEIFFAEKLIRTASGKLIRDEARIFRHGETDDEAG
jgi:long-chain acyl-CoA synthetase